jgi:hypothetical protein
MTERPWAETYRIDFRDGRFEVWWLGRGDPRDAPPPSSVRVAFGSARLPLRRQ